MNYLGLCSAKLGFDENAEVYYLLGVELDDQHNSIKYNLGVFYKNQNRISDTKKILSSLKNCENQLYTGQFNNYLKFNNLNLLEENLAIDLILQEMQILMIENHLARFLNFRKHDL